MILLPRLVEPDRALRAEARSVAETYLRAIEEGDGDAAAALLEPTDETRACPELLTSEVYREVDDRPSDPAVTDVEISSDGDAVVDFLYNLDPTASAVGALHLTRSGETWAVTDLSDLVPERIVVFLAGPGDLTFDGACTLPPDEIDTIVAFPGSYDITYADPANVGTAEPVAVRVPQEGLTTVTPQLQPDVEAEVLAAVTAKIQGCLDAHLDGLACEGIERDRLDHLDVTSIGAIEEGFAVTVFPSVANGPSPAAWFYETTMAIAPVEGVIRADGCLGADSRCVPGTTQSTQTFFPRFTGTVSRDADGVVILS